MIVVGWTPPAGSRVGFGHCISPIMTQPDSCNTQAALAPGSMTVSWAECAHS
jgi:hypothetical protein